MNNNYNCSDCARQGCIHRDAFRRLPKSQGGLGLCPGRIDQPEPDTDARMEKLIFNKEKFLRTDFGKALMICVTDLDTALTVRSTCYVGSDEYWREQKTSELLLAQLQVYRAAIQQFYGLQLWNH